MKPSDSDVLGWSSSESNVVKPGTGALAAGWQLGQVAISAWQNFVDRGQNLWISWLKGLFEGTEGDFRLVHSRTSATEAALILTQGPEAHAAGNGFRPVFEASAGANRTVKLLTGKLSLNEGAALVTGAYWDPNTQLWNQEPSGQHSTGIVLDSGAHGLRVWRKNAGSGPWGTASWGFGPARIGHLEVDSVQLNGTLAATTLDLSGSADIDGALTVSDLTVEDDITIHNGGDFLYDTTKTVTYIVDMREGQKDASLVYTAAPGSAADTYRSTVDGSVIDVPLRVPVGCTVVSVTAVCDTPTASEVVSLSVFRVSPNFATGAHIKALQGSTVSSSSSGVQILESTMSSVSASVGTPQVFYARLEVDEDAYVRMGIRVQIETLNPRHG